LAEKTVQAPAGLLSSLAKKGEIPTNCQAKLNIISLVNSSLQIAALLQTLGWCQEASTGFAIFNLTVVRVEKTKRSREMRCRQLALFMIEPRRHYGHHENYLVGRRRRKRWGDLLALLALRASVLGIEIKKGRDDARPGVVFNFRTCAN
jgi:hypothetical protein